MLSDTIAFGVGSLRRGYCLRWWPPFGAIFRYNTQKASHSMHSIHTLPAVSTVPSGRSPGQKEAVYPQTDMTDINGEPLLGNAFTGKLMAERKKLLETRTVTRIGPHYPLSAGDINCNWKSHLRKCVFSDMSRTLCLKEALTQEKCKKGERQKTATLRKVQRDVILSLIHI